MAMAWSPSASPVQLVGPRFAFLDLYEELKDELVAVLDLATRLSLSLTCTALRKYFRSIKNYNNWEFIDTCCRCGYTELLQWARKGGSQVGDLRSLELALEYNRTDIALWLRSLLAPFDSDHNLTFVRHAARNGNRELTNVFVGYNDGQALKAATIAAAEGGHIDLSLEMRARRLKVAQESALDLLLSYYAASGGFLAAALALCTTPRAPTKAEMDSIFEGACKGGHMDVIRYAIEHGATPKKNTLTNKAVITNLSLLQCFYDLLPEFMAANLQAVTISALLSPRKHILIFLKEHGAVFNNASLTALFRLVLYGSLGNYLGLGDAEEHNERFECIKYLHSMGLQWDSTRLDMILVWATVDQIQWILDRSESPALQRALSPYLNFTMHADMTKIKFIFDNCPNLNISLVEVLLLENNLEVLDFVLSILGVDKFPNAFTGLQTFTTFIHDLVTNSIPAKIHLDEKRRFRPVNALNLLRWLFEKGLTGTWNNAVEIVSKENIDSTSHPYFIREAKKIFLQYLKRDLWAY